MFYVPFWEFSVVIKTTYSGSKTVIQKVDGIAKEVLAPCQATRSVDYNQVLVCADMDLPVSIVELINAISDWKINRANSFQPVPCEGLIPVVNKYSSSSSCWTKAFDEIKKKEKQECLEKLKKDEKVDNIQGFQAKVDSSNLNQKLLYFPVYVSSYQYEGKTYPFVVSGQSGSVQAQRPYGLGKVGELGSMIGGLFFGPSNKK